MRTRISDLIRDAISIIEHCGDDDCQAWLNQARAELAVMSAKAALREALGQVAGPIKPKLAKPALKPAPTFKPAPKGKNGKFASTAKVGL